MRSLPSSGTTAVQVFTPTSIVSIGAGGSLDTTEISVIRVPDPVDYQINGVGTIGTMSGTTGISTGVSSITFVTATTVEVM